MIAYLFSMSVISPVVIEVGSDEGLLKALAIALLILSSGLMSNLSTISDAAAVIP